MVLKTNTSGCRCHHSGAVSQGSGVHVHLENQLLVLVFNVLRRVAGGGPEDAVQIRLLALAHRDEDGVRNTTPLVPWSGIKRLTQPREEEGKMAEHRR